MYFWPLCFGYALNNPFVYLAIPGAHISKICLFYLYATAKNEIQICSNKHETGLVMYEIPCFLLNNNEYLQYIFRKKKNQKDYFSKYQY